MICSPGGSRALTGSAREDATCSNDRHQQVHSQSQLVEVLVRMVGKNEQLGWRFVDASPLILDALLPGCTC